MGSITYCRLYLLIEVILFLLRESLGLPSLPVQFFLGQSSPIYPGQLLSDLSFPTNFYTLQLDIFPKSTTPTGGTTLANIMHLTTLGTDSSGISIPSVSFDSNSTKLLIEMVKSNYSYASSASANPPLPLASWSTVSIKVLASSMIISVYVQNAPQSVLWAQTVDLIKASSSFSSSAGWPFVHVYLSDPFNNCAKNVLVSNIYLYQSSNCYSGTYAPANFPSNCVYSPPGTYSLAGATAPTNCSAGYFNSASGQASCSAAPPGSYASSSGSITYYLCAAGSYSPSPAG
jgi:hypothetical protein